MKVQLYDDGLARVFKGADGICDVWAKDGKDTEGIEAALRRIRMRRVGQWKHYRAGGFREAGVRWAPPSEGHSV